MNRPNLTAPAIALALFLAALWPHDAFADKRVALIIGNSSYRHVPTLANPTRDAQAIAAKFKQAGYEVVTANDVDNLQFKRVVREFEDTAVGADVAVVFYSGHGIEIKGANYLIPADARLASDRDVEDEAVPLDRLVASVDGAKQLGLIILDACRDNPFVSTMRRRLPPTRGLPFVEPTRPASIEPAALSQVEPTTRNTLIAFAAKAGTAAEDGNGEHSPFTNALLNNLFEPGLDVRLGFGRVRDEVLKTTSQRQEPFVYGSLGGQHVTLVPAPAQVQVPVPDLSGQKADYELVAKVGTKRAWEVFLAQHATGFYADLARLQLAKLTEQQEGAQRAADEAARAKRQQAETTAEQAKAEAAKLRRSELEDQLRNILAELGNVERGGAAVDDARSYLRSLDRDRDVRALIGRGRSYALLIGNKDYRDPNFGRLETPHEDANSLATLLTTEYGFTTELILPDGSSKNLVLLDRPARELNSLLDDLEGRMTTDDRLLIFYAGHGYLDERTQKAYWIPVEATHGRRSEFILSDAIVSSLRGIKARSVLVIADSCFSGAFFRAPAGPDPSEAEFATSLAKDVERSSRVLIASGGTEPVLDGGGGGHSIFMRKLLDALENPIRPIFSARELHVRRLKPSVSGNVKQVPQYDWLRESGHDAGDFVFVHVQSPRGTAAK